jgi:hypothetical protein
MFYAAKIRMKSGCANSDRRTEIDEIYLTGCNEEKFYKKAAVYDYLINNPDSIKVNRSPFPFCQPVLSRNNEKYVRS